MGKQSESYVAEVVSVWCCGCVGPRFELDTEGPDRYRSREPLLPAFVTGTTWQTVVKKKKPKKKHAPSFKVVVRTPHRWSYCAQYSSLSKDIHAHCTTLTSSRVTYREIGIRAFSNTMKLFLEKKRVSLES